MAFVCVCVIPSCSIIASLIRFVYWFCFVYLLVVLLYGSLCTNKWRYFSAAPLISLFYFIFATADLSLPPVTCSERKTITCRKLRIWWNWWGCKSPRSFTVLFKSDSEIQLCLGAVRTHVRVEMYFERTAANGTSSSRGAIGRIKRHSNRLQRSRRLCRSCARGTVYYSPLRKIIQKEPSRKWMPDTIVLECAHSSK